MELNAFDPADAVALLVGQSPAERRIPRALAKRIVQTLGGHPFYLQLVGEALVEHEPPYDDKDFKDALQAVLISYISREHLGAPSIFSRHAVGSNSVCKLSVPVCPCGF